ncbi:MAG: hypothetical protein A2511_01920 [Deltaproteobacteria bacterium RIFOXYD12_FULL_50_9]|nr:MAG: hypothetical protein A2511_01920 [Deltaproteobacteria bacterium RIFOXYD12_FULL_50_9]
MRKLTTEQFISNAKKVHGDRYDYSEVVYAGNKAKITIICPEHGKFEQAPVEHANGSGCRICSHRRAGDNRRTSKEDFVLRAEKIHGRKYDYSLVNIETLATRVKIICPEHGVFEQVASGHVAGSGCRQCANKIRNDNNRLSLDGFIRRARKVHGECYDYSAVVYVGINIKVTIYCPVHGVFEQDPSNHLHGSGCPTCATKKRGMNRRLAHSEFLRRAREVHGDKYDYSHANIENSKSSVKIVCPEHGVFEQIPSNHLLGNGCLLCGFKNAGQYHKKNTTSYIFEAQKIHGDRYDYSATDYKGAREKLTIICPEHGPFDQVAHVHLRGAGCDRCSYEARGDRAKMPFAEFLQRVKQVHGEVYDYSLAEDQYQGASSKITIICREHGEFSQITQAHLQGQGCATCGDIRTAAILRKTTDDFIRDAKGVHGDKYDYSMVDYKGAFEGIKIICKIDGIFAQSPTAHLSGIGCPKCSRRGQGAPRNLTRALRGEFDKPQDSFMYIITFTAPYSATPLHKIGSGTGSRGDSVQTQIRRACGTDICAALYQFKTMGEAIVFEHLAHEQVRDYQFVVPVEFKFPGHTEVFSKLPDLAAVQDHPTLSRFRAGERWNHKRRNTGE